MSRVPEIKRHQMKKLIKVITPKTPIIKFFQKYILTKYFITVFLFLIWMVFFYNTSFLVVNELNGEINRYEKQLAYYKDEYKKNDNFFKKLMTNKSEKEKFARENYFMKKPNEEIFILVVDSTNLKRADK